MEWLKAFTLTALIFISLERVLAIRPEQKMLRRGWFNDLVYWVVNGHIISFFLAAFVTCIVFTTSWLVPESVHATVAAQPYWLQFIEALVLSDIGFYFTHRAFHAIPVLWKFHAIHHSIEELDWLAAARVHPVDQIMTKGASLLPVFALGFSDVVIGAYMLLYSWQSVLIHSNVRINFGPLRWLLASPEFHHWHHSKDRQARDRNFAGQLPLLDVIFGTLHMPLGQRPTAYGIDAPMPENYLSQLAHPFRSAVDSASQVDAANAAVAPAVEASAPPRPLLP
jgi:sterol desaturase/sphingolipid hydroxylase (fatty acid hydroxylase superfamily)